MNESQRLGTPSPQRVAIVRALPGLGDMLCAVPALRALRQALPAAMITLIGLPWAESLVGRFPRYLDAFAPFPGFPGIAEQAVKLRELPAQLAALQAEEFDLAVQLHGNGSIMNVFTLLLGARATTGFYLPGLYCPDPTRFLPYPAQGHEIERLLALLAFLGVPAQGTDLEFPVTEADGRVLQAIPAAGDLRPGAYVCLHPGAKATARRWEPARFAALADRLAGQGLRVVLTGTPAEADLTGAVAAAMRAPVLDLTGQTDLGTLAALLQGARLLICNDTGVSHLAAALRVPSVIIFTGSDPARWAPLDRRRHRVVIAAAVADPGVPAFAAPAVSPPVPVPAAQLERRVWAAADSLLRGEVD